MHWQHLGCTSRVAIETKGTISCKVTLRMQIPTAISDKPTQANTTAWHSTAQHSTAQPHPQTDTETDTQTDTHTDTHHMNARIDTDTQRHTHTQSKSRQQAATCSRCAHSKCALSGVCRSPCQRERSWACCASAPPECLPALPHQARAPPPCVTGALALSGLDPAPASQQALQWSQCWPQTSLIRHGHSQQP